MFKVDIILKNISKNFIKSTKALVSFPIISVWRCAERVREKRVQRGQKRKQNIILLVIMSTAIYHISSRAFCLIAKFAQ